MAVAFDPKADYTNRHKLLRMCLDRGISQEKLAAKLQLLGIDVTQKSVSRIETGDRVVADYELLALAKALDVSVEYLLNG